MIAGLRGHLRTTGLAALLALLLGCEIAPQDAPWEPLSLDHPLGWATGLKLSHIARDPAACREALATAAQLEFRPAAPDAGTSACPLTDAVAVQRTTIRYGQEFAASCPLAASLYLWEREVVQPAARQYLSAEVERIETFGTFACRNIYNRDDDRKSEHASANAIDIAAFHLSSGRRITVLREWSGDDGDGAFLRAVRDGSCRLFNGVLGPDYNAAHANHLHLDMGPYRICS